MSAWSHGTGWEHDALVPKVCHEEDKNFQHHSVHVAHLGHHSVDPAVPRLIPGRVEVLLLVWLTQLTAMKLRSSCKGGALCMGSKIVRNAWPSYVSLMGSYAYIHTYIHTHTDIHIYTYV